MVADAYAEVAAALLEVIAAMSARIGELEQALAGRFRAHPDADIIVSLPGLAVVPRKPPHHKVHSRETTLPTMRTHASSKQR